MFSVSLITRIAPPALGFFLLFFLLPLFRAALLLLLFPLAVFVLFLVILTVDRITYNRMFDVVLEQGGSCPFL